jgi:hypothetical protein
METDS